MVRKGLAGFGWLQGAGPHGGLCGVHPLLLPGACRLGMRLSQRPSSGACGPEPICMGAINSWLTLFFVPSLHRLAFPPVFRCFAR